MNQLTLVQNMASKEKQNAALLKPKKPISKHESAFSEHDSNDNVDDPLISNTGQQLLDNNTTLRPQIESIGVVQQPLNHDDNDSTERKQAKYGRKKSFVPNKRENEIIMEWTGGLLKEISKFKSTDTQKTGSALYERIQNIENILIEQQRYNRTKEEKQRDIANETKLEDAPMTPVRLIIEFCASIDELDAFRDIMVRAGSLSFDQQLAALTVDEQQQLILALFPDEYATADRMMRFQSILAMFHQQREKLPHISPIKWDEYQIALSFMMYTATEINHNGTDHRLEANELIWRFIHFLRSFCVNKKWNGIKLNEFWSEITGNGIDTDLFGERMTERVCTHFEIDVDPFERVMQLLPLWYHDALRRFKLYPVVLADCSVEDIVTLFMFKADDDDDEKERNSDREDVDGVFCRFEKRGGDDMEYITKVMQWKEKIVQWIRSEKVDGKKLMETDNEQLIEGMKKALNIESDDNESFDSVFAVILDLCRQSAVDEILKNVKQRKVTRFDALKQYLVQQHGVDEKEIDILNEMVMENGYESETLLLSEQWMKSGKAPWNQLKCAQFIATFLRDRECMFSPFFSSLFLSLFRLIISLRSKTQ